MTKIGLLQPFLSSKMTEIGLLSLCKSFQSSKIYQIYQIYPIHQVNRNWIQNGQCPFCINIFYSINRLSFTVCCSIRGKPPLLMHDMVKFIDFRSIIHCFQFETIYPQEPDGDPKHWKTGQLSLVFECSEFRSLLHSTTKFLLFSGLSVTV